MRSSSGSFRDSGQDKRPLKQTDDPIYRQQPWRFVNLAVFILASLVNSLPTHTFTTINSIISDTYQFNKVLVSLNTLLFPISHPVLAFVANWILDKYGLRIGCSIGMGFLAVGVWLRVLINQSFAAVLIGSLLASIGNIFIINSPSKMANVWFRPVVAPRVTTLGVMANMASIGLGVVLPSLFIHEDPNHHDSTDMKNNIRMMLIYEAAIVTVPAILLIALIRNKPKVPPSFAAGVDSKSNYKQDLKTLFKNKNYLWLLLSMSMSYGSLTCYTTCIEYIALPFNLGKAETVSSLMLVCAMLAGFVSSVIFVILLRKSFAFKKIIGCAMVGTVLQLIMQIFTFDTDRLWLLLFVVTWTGFFFIPQVALFLQFGCELVFPIGQASSSGFLLAGGQLTGFLTGLAGVGFLQKDNKSKVYIVIGCLAALVSLGIVALSFVKQDLRKVNYQKSKSQASLKDQQQQ